MGIGLGTEAGFLAAFFHILAHSVTKSLLFLTTPRLAEVSGSSLKFSALTGSAKRNPVAGFFFLMGALSMIGIPIFAGFASKIQFGIAAVDSSSTLKMVLVMIVLAISSALNAFYFLRTVLRIYSVTQHSQADEKVYVSGLDYTIPMVVLTAANLGLGLVSPVVLNLITTGMRMFA
jgi:multicomponent Na+:H+ antiporter subunit D